MAPKPNIVFGAASIGDKSATAFAKFDTPSEVTTLLDLLHTRGYHHIDTARSYAPGAPGSSEPRLGAALTDPANSRFSFTVDSKALFARAEHPHSRANFLASVDVSLAALPKLHTYYLHMPDRTVPFEETLAAVDEAYRAGKFEQFGVSNFRPDEVEDMVRIADEKGWVRPTVYQGQYNPVVRKFEKELLPVLRKHGIALYAYSPSAGGFFAGNHKGASTRFDKSINVGKLYSSWYEKPELEEAFQRAKAAGEGHGISGHAAALRWTVYHSAIDYTLGDAVIIGASTLEQLTQNLDIIEDGPLPQGVADAMGAVYGYVGEGEINPFH